MQRREYLLHWVVLADNGWAWGSLLGAAEDDESNRSNMIITVNDVCSVHKKAASERGGDSANGDDYQSIGLSVCDVWRSFTG